MAAALTLAGYLLYRVAAQYGVEEMSAALLRIPGVRIASALGFAAASYVCLTGFDYLGLRYAGHRLPYRYVALASFVSLSFGHNIGVASLSTGALRYRFYARKGLGVGDVARVILFSGMTVGLGLMVLGGAALLFAPAHAQKMTGLSQSLLFALGVACFTLVALYVLAAARVRGSVRLYRWKLPMPSLPLALGQIALGSANFAFVAACLYQGVSLAEEVTYVVLASTYVIAQVAALISHVPGGLGVLEATVVLLLPQAQVIGALILFRLVYFLLPLALGAILFVLSESLHGRAAKDGQQLSVASP